MRRRGTRIRRRRSIRRKKKEIIGMQQIASYRIEVGWKLNVECCLAVGDGGGLHNSELC